MNEGWFEVTSAPATEPVTRSELSLWAKVDSSDDNDILDSLIKASRSWAEKYTRRGFITQTVKCYFDQFYNSMILNINPVSAVSSVEYYDSENTLQTLSTDVYDVNMKSEPTEITLSDQGSWPPTFNRPNAVIITMTVGYGAAAAVPEDIKTAIKMIASHWYENRQDVIVGRQVNEVPFTSRMILDNYRVFIYK